MGHFMESTKEETDRALVEHWRRVAREVVDSLELVLREPALPLHPTGPAQFPKLDVKWLEAQTAALQQRGFRFLRDVDGTRLTAQHTWPMLVRVLLAADGRTTAALFHVRPKAPGVFAWLLLKLMGRWPKPQQVIELNSYGDEGILATTNAQSSFQRPPGSSLQALSQDTPLDALLAAHARSIAPVKVRVMESFEALNEAREAQRARNLRWRQEVGLLPEELEALLAPHGKHGAAVRPHLVDELKRRAREHGEAWVSRA